MIPRLARAFERADAVWARVEVAALTLLTGAMLALGLTQVILRNAFSYGLEGGDQVLRVLVLWVGVLGASLATRHGQHISIDAAGRFARGPAKRILSGLVRLAAAGICVVLLLAALDYLEAEEILTRLAGGRWELRLNALAFPLALAVMAWRFALGALHDACGLEYGRPAEGGPACS